MTPMRSRGPVTTQYASWFGGTRPGLVAATTSKPEPRHAHASCATCCQAAVHHTSNAQGPPARRRDGHAQSSCCDQRLLPFVPSAAEPDDALAQTLKACGHPQRLRLLRFTTQPRTLEQIAGHLSVARQSANEHVDKLLAAGVLERGQARGPRGPVTVYSAAVPRLFDMYERLGARIGLMSGNLEHEVRGSLPTTVSPPPSGRRPPESPRLTIVHGMRIGQTIPLHGDGPWLVGRDPHAALCLDYDPYVSHRHAEIRRTRHGFEVADALSSNGTWIDWEQAARGGAVAIENGSLLRFGRSLVLFRLPRGA